jgi:biopolymer transport protein ExbB/biopolymer transport protein TolQ
MLVQKLLSVAEVTGQGVLYLLIGLSVISIGIILERIVWFRRRRVATHDLGRRVVTLLRRNEREEAKKILAASRSVEARVLLEALDSYDDGPDSFIESLQASLKEHRGDAEAGLLYLGTLGSNAPFVGLFGTVLGIVTAFRELASASQQGMANVMGGIAEALVATAVGILVAIPAVVAFNILQKKAGEVEDNVSALGNHVLALMKSPAQRQFDDKGAR